VRKNTYISLCMKIGGICLSMCMKIDGVCLSMGRFIIKYLAFRFFLFFRVLIHAAHAIPTMPITVSTIVIGPVIVFSLFPSVSGGLFSLLVKFATTPGWGDQQHSGTGG
jgi:hypothetical protein